MDITLIWFPLLKFIVTAGLLYGVYYFFSKKNTAIGIWYLVLIGIFWAFMPIKYDGTNSVERSKSTQKMRTAEYRNVVKTTEVVHTKKPTFAERMAAEEARSAEANQKVTNEIVK